MTASVENSSIQYAQHVHNMPLKNKGDSKEHQVAIAYYITPQEKGKSKLYAILLLTSKGKGGVSIFTLCSGTQPFQKSAVQYDSLICTASVQATLMLWLCYNIMLCYVYLLNI